MNIGVIGSGGVVGGALVKAAAEKFSVATYDKFKGPHNIDDLKHTDMIFVCVPTPTTVGGLQDLGAVMDVMSRLSAMKYIKNPVVLKSTVLPGVTTSLVADYPELQLVHNPEFLTQKNAVEDFKNQKAVLLSSKSASAMAAVENFYRDLLPGTPVLCANHYEYTEWAKYMHNCFLATKVAFFNEFYEVMSVSYSKVLEMATSQGAIGDTHTKVPGPDGKFGFGGACFPKDTESLLGACSGDELSILRAAVESNKKIRR